MEVVAIIFVENIPIYVQIQNHIKENIINGNLKEGQKLPSIRTYCMEYGVTSLTMQRAISELEREGIINTVKGVGCFVCEGVLKNLKKGVSKDMVERFVESMQNMGFERKEIIKMVEEAF